MENNSSEESQEIEGSQGEDKVVAGKKSPKVLITVFVLVILALVAVGIILITQKQTSHQETGEREIEIPTEINLNEEEEEMTGGPEGVTIEDGSWEGPLAIPSPNNNAYTMDIKIIDETKLNLIENAYLMTEVAELIGGEEANNENVIIVLETYERNYEDYPEERNRDYFYLKQKFNAKYFLLLKNMEIEPNKYSFSNGVVQITFSKEPDSLIPYLESPKYCETQSDCVIRQNFCTLGGYNKYHLFLDAWGCTDLMDEDGVTYSAMPFAEEGECAMPAYGKVECIENSCVAKDKTCAEYY